jgi:hypothetical protein
MRARSRYEFDLTWEDYLKACNSFNEPGFHFWKTDTGDLEAWVDIHGIKVCAHYKPLEGLISTLLEPPEQIGSELEESGSNQIKLLKAELHRLKNHKIHDSDYDRSFKIGEYILFLKEELKESRMSEEALGSWYKGQFQKITRLLKEGDQDKAWALASCLASSPRAFDPLLDPEKASELLEILAEKKLQLKKEEK